MQNLRHLLEPKPNRRLRSTSDDHTQSHRRDLPRLREHCDEPFHVAVIVTLVERIDHKHNDGWRCLRRGLLERLRDELPPLFRPRLARDTRLLLHRLDDVLLDVRLSDRELDGNAREQHSRMRNIAAASHEEEATSEASSTTELSSDRSRDRGLARPGHAVQPEDAASLLSIHPCSYLLQHFRARVFEA